MKKQMTGMVIIGQVNMETSMSEVVTDTRPTIKKGTLIHSTLGGVSRPVPEAKQHCFCKF